MSSCVLIMARLVYSPRYNIGLFGLERFHPFDSRKYGRAWRVLKRHFGSEVKALRIRTDRQANEQELLLIHSPDYLQRLRNSAYVAGALEVPPARKLPWRVIDWCVLRPMRWATRGTILAAEEAIRHGLAVNLSGGYHHAKPNSGEGFCIYSDIAIAIAHLRQSGQLKENARVAYIDLDVHQGNGVCHAFLDDPRVFIFDMYNRTIYPLVDVIARDRIDCRLDLPAECDDSFYLQKLRGALPGFLDSIGQQQEIGLAIYNAGTDIYKDDPLGNMGVTAAGILERDLYVASELRSRGIPTVMVLSGGYTRQSYELVARSVRRLLETY